MIRLRNEEIENRLNEGAVIYLEGSNANEKRLYRYNKDLNILEYSDNNKDWNKSSMKLEDLKSKSWVIYK